MCYLKVGIRLLQVGILLPLLLLQIGCTNNIVLHPLTDKDIYDGKNAGDKCFSSYYLDQVMQVKIDKSK